MTVCQNNHIFRSHFKIYYKGAMCHNLHNLTYLIIFSCRYYLFHSYWNMIGPYVPNHHHISFFFFNSSFNHNFFVWGLKFKRLKVRWDHLFEIYVMDTKKILKSSINEHLLSIKHMLWLKFIKLTISPFLW